MPPPKDHFWETLKREQVYDGSPFLKVELHTVKLPDGRIIDDYHHITSGTYANVIPVAPDGRFYVLNQYRYGADRIGYALPGGRIEEGEDPAGGAMRELKEEMGLVSESLELLGKYNVSCSYGLSDNFYFLGLNTVPDQEAALMESDDLEWSETLSLSQDEARNAIRDNRFVSLSHVAGVSMAMLYLSDSSRT